MTTDTFNSGSGNWTVPAGITSVVVELWGGGGGGGAGGAGSSAGSGGGGGGGYCKKTLSVSPSDTIAYSVGAAGTKSVAIDSSTDGTNGGNSTATYSSTTYTAAGGSRGLNPADGGTGGAGGGNTNADTGFTGGTGSNKISNVGGGGGGSAGTAANGNSVSASSTGATAVTGGGGGGNGGASGLAGSTGSTPGGGGGGGGKNAIGGNGAAGRVSFTYIPASVGTAAGDSTASGVSNLAVGTAAGGSTASGVGQIVVNSVATAAGSSTASGVGQTTFTSASTTVYPNGDGTISGWTTESSGTTNLYLSIDEGTDSPNDADYVQKSNTGVQTVRYWQLGDMPSNFGTATAVTLKIRCNRTSSKSDYVQITGCQLFQSDETTAITAFAGIADSTTITTYTLNPSITGGTSKTIWDGARIGVTVNSGSTGSSVRLYAAQVQVTYAALPIGDGTASGDSTASGVGQSTDNSVATASGDSTASGVSPTTASATASGDSTASGVGQSTDNSVATASGDSTASGVGQSASPSTASGTAAGDSTASGVGQSTDNSVATASGDSTASGVGQSTVNSVGNAQATSSANMFNLAGVVVASGTASGTSKGLGRTKNSSAIKTTTPLKQACSASQRMSKLAALAMMPSIIDKSKLIVVETGRIIPNRGYSEDQVKENITNGVWAYYEKMLPRRMFLTNPDWSVSSFDPRTRSICIQINSPSGPRMFSFVAPSGVGLQYGNPTP